MYKIETIKVTPPQKELLNLLQHKEAEDYFNSMKKVHYLGTYSVEI